MKSNNGNKRTDIQMNKKGQTDKIDNKLKINKKYDEDDCDGILRELDELERRNIISSKVRNLIQEDKEAIKSMKREESSETESKSKKTQTNKKNNIRKNKVDTTNEKKDDLIKEEVKESISNAGFNMEESEDDEDKMDFLASLDKKNQNEFDSLHLRKKEPKRLQKEDGYVERIKKYLQSKSKNFYVGVAIPFLAIILLIALICDRGTNTEKPSEGDFVDIDTTPIESLVNNYYSSLKEYNVENMREYLVDGTDATDEEIKKECETSLSYTQLISDDFKITKCYLQKGLEDDEYIAYIKFQISIKNIETPAVGIFTCYVVGSKDENGKEIYKLDNSVTDVTSPKYRYIAKMKNCSNVSKVFQKVEDEFNEACSKDENLKALVTKLNHGEDDSADINETTSGDDSTKSQQTDSLETTSN